MKEENTVREKSYAFALRVVNAVGYLREEKREFDLARQLLRSGTGIGANIEEALGAYSAPDFLSKLTISYKEAREAHYWIRLLRDSGHLPQNAASSLLADADELLRLIGSIQCAVKKRNGLECREEDADYDSTPTARRRTEVPDKATVSVIQMDDA